MLYLNHAGTSWPKPAPVVRAVAAAMEEAPELWPTRFAGHHRRVAAAFGIEDPSRLLLTPGCTAALGVAISDLPWRSGERVVTSSWEHHALLRPVLALAARGVEHVAIPPAGADPLDLECLRRTLAQGGVRLVAMTGAANVTGAMLPITEVLGLAHAHGARVLVDAAQLAGWLELDVRTWGPGGVDMLTFAGHKGPQAPWGVGGLYVARGVDMAAPRLEEGGPRFEQVPSYCDTGSVDRLALAGLVAGLDWLAAPAQAGRLARARARISQLRAGLLELPGVEVLGPSAGAQRVPSLALRVAGRPSSALALALRARGLIVSGGMQCAVQAHQTLGTAREGVVRISVGPEASPELVEPVCAAFAAELV